MYCTISLRCRTEMTEWLTHADTAVPLCWVHCLNTDRTRRTDSSVTIVYPTSSKCVYHGLSRIPCEWSAHCLNLSLAFRRTLAMACLLFSNNKPGTNTLKLSLDSVCMRCEDQRTVELHSWDIASVDTWMLTAKLADAVYLSMDICPWSIRLTCGLCQTSQAKHIIKLLFIAQ